MHCSTTTPAAAERAAAQSNTWQDTPAMLAFTLPYPPIVWAADELRRGLLRHSRQ
ncbi:hypothetical protein [Nocardia asiatica]